MDEFYGHYINRLESLHNDLKSSLTGLDLAGLDWIPGDGMNSLSVLAVHVAGSERYWIGDVVAGEPSGRDRDAEFLVRGLDAAALTQHLDASLAYIQRVLDGLAVGDLESSRIHPREGTEISIGWALSHVLAHTGLHAGHAQLTRQIRDQA